MSLACLVPSLKCFGLKLCFFIFFYDDSNVESHILMSVTGVFLYHDDFSSTERYIYIYIVWPHSVSYVFGRFFF